MDTLFIQSLFCLILLTPFALSIAKAPFSLVVVFTGLIFWLFRWRKRNESFVAFVGLTTCLFIFLGLFLYSLMDGLGSSLTQAGLNLLILSSFILLFSLRILATKFGQISLICTSLFQFFVLSLVFSAQFEFFLYFFFFTVAFFQFLFVLHLHRRMAFSTKTDSTIKSVGYAHDPRSGWRFLLFSGGATFVILFLSLVFFLTLPRPKDEFSSSVLNRLESAPKLSSSFGTMNSLPSPKNNEILKFPEEIEFPNEAPSSHIYNVALRVQLVNTNGRSFQLEAPLYLRGNIFEVYAQEKWKPTLLSFETQLDNQDGNLDQQMTFSVLPLRRQNGKLFLQNISLAPHLSKVCFALAEPYRISGVSTIQHFQGILEFPKELTESIDYQILSFYRPINLRQINVSVDTSYLHLMQLPKSVSPWISQIAERVTSPTQSDIEKIQALLHYFKTQFTYQFYPTPPPKDVSELDYFLGTTRKGNCTHFATAFALTLRYLKIPCRLVGGYMGGTWAEFGEYYEFQQKNAHAWVEIPFQGEGFLSFDSTPASPSGIEEEIAEKTRISEAKITEVFSDWTLNYDQKKQQKLFENMTFPFFLLATCDTRSLEKWLMGIALVFFLGWFFLQMDWPFFEGTWNTFWRYRVKQSWHSVSRATPQIQQQLKKKLIFQVYHQSLKTLSRYGYRRKMAQTPEEYLVALPVSVQVGFKEITHLFQRAFYGEKDVSREELDRCMIQFHQLHQYLKKTSP